jgi:hypothetical protein
MSIGELVMARRPAKSINIFANAKRTRVSGVKAARARHQRRVFDGYLHGPDRPRITVSLAPRFVKFW